MKHVLLLRRAELTGAVIIFICALTLGLLAPRPPIPDIAWLIEASRRWLEGAELYRDIIEVNPPLIFYETVALTGGQLTGYSYVAGVCVIIGLSALWVLRFRGTNPALCALAAMILGGLPDFGQRDHLALIMVIPMLLGEHAPRSERIALGLWAFLGIGLKPYLVPIPVAALVAAMVMRRTWLPPVEMLALGCAGGLYVGFVILMHPAYLNEVVPLGQFVYHAYGTPPNIGRLGVSVLLVIVPVVTLLLKDRERIPLSFAVLAALASYYAQGRNWSYHFVPSVGLGLLLALWGARQQKALIPIAVTLVGAQLWRGPFSNPRPPAIAADVRSMAVLSTHVYSAYPRGLTTRNATRYPSLWTLPGAWNIAHDAGRSSADQERARRLLATERATIRKDIYAANPQVIVEEAAGRQDYFQYPFNYMAFLGPFPEYRRAYKSGRYTIYEKHDR